MVLTASSKVPSRPPKDTETPKDADTPRTAAAQEHVLEFERVQFGEPTGTVFRNQLLVRDKKQPDSHPRDEDEGSVAIEEDASDRAIPPAGTEEPPVNGEAPVSASEKAHRLQVGDVHCSHLAEGVLIQQISADSNPHSVSEFIPFDGSPGVQLQAEPLQSLRIEVLRSNDSHLRIRFLSECTTMAIIEASKEGWERLRAAPGHKWSEQATGDGTDQTLLFAKS